MRSFLFLFCFLCALTACNKRTDVLITGEIDGLTQSEIILHGFRPDSNENVRRIAVRENSFAITLIPDSIWPVILVLDGVLEIPIFAARGDEIDISGNMNDPSTFTVEGGDKINQELNQWRQKKETLENFLQKHPDHPASAWLILNEAMTQETLNAVHIKQLFSMVTPRIAESNLLSPLKKEVERQVPNLLEIPYYTKEARIILRADQEKLDTIFTHEALKNQIDTLLKSH